MKNCGCFARRRLLRIVRKSSFSAKVGMNSTVGRGLAPAEILYEIIREVPLPLRTTYVCTKFSICYKPKTIISTLIFSAGASPRPTLSANMKLSGRFRFLAPLRCVNTGKNALISQIATEKRQIVKPGWWHATEAGGIIKA